MANEGHKPFLPFEIIINILKRLPIKSIVRFQCVCKDWKNLFKTQSFIDEQVLHSAHENPLLLIHAYNYKCRSSSLRLLNHEMETVEVLRTPSIDSFNRGWRIIGCSNGLLCVELDTDKDRFPISLCLWNPVSNEVREVPEPLYDYTHSCKVGFGFNSAVNDYKIVRFYHDNLLRKDAHEHYGHDRLYCVQVYSLRTGSWKELEMGGLHHARIFAPGVSVNGTIFWYGMGLFNQMLVAFDIATEVFTLTRIDTLSHNVDVAVHGLCPSGVYVYGNKLAMCNGYNFVDGGSDKYSFYMSVIEEGASELGKSYSCTQRYRIGPISNVLRPVCIWRNEIVCRYMTYRHEKSEDEAEGDKENFLYLFNLTTKEWKKFPNFSAAYHRYDIFNYERSLASVCNP